MNENNIENPEVNNAVPIENNQEVSPIMTVKDWVITLILLSIPLVNIIMIIVWAVNDTTNRNKKNFALATLIMWGIAIVLFIILGSSFFALLSSIAPAG
jgi:uncharacterized membrane protein YqjE